MAADAVAGGARRGAAWRAYFEASALLTSELEQRMKASCGLDLVDFNVLLLLAEAPGERLRMGELARGMSFAPGRLTYRVGQLEQRGWVRRQAVPGDRRGTLAVLEDAGRRALRRARPLHARHVDELFLRDIDDEDAARLLAIFAPVREALRGAAAPCTSVEAAG